MSANQPPESNGSARVPGARAEAERPEDHEWYRLVLEHAPVGIAVCSGGKIVFANAAGARLMGAGSPAEVAGKPLGEIIRVGSLGATQDLIRRLLAGEQGLHPVEDVFVHADGRQVPVEVVAVPVTFLGQSAVQLAIVDIATRKQVEQALHAKADELERYFSDALDLLCIASTDGHFLRLNRQWEATLGYSLSELVGRRFFELVHPDDLEATRARIARLGSQEDVALFKNRYRCRDGSYKWIEWRSRPAGNVIYAVARDITDRVRAEEELREKDRLLGESQRIAHVGSWARDLATGQVYWSEETYRILGLVDGEVAPSTATLLTLVHPDDRIVMQNWIRACQAGASAGDLEYRVVRPDGVTRMLLGRGHLERGADGSPVRVVGTVQDITDRKRAEAERGELAEQLESVQKMEAIGQLAGGVAHDFNNLLSVILSYAGFARDALHKADPLRADIEVIRDAAGRAAALTRQLLAFSRRQVLAPRVLDLNRVAADLEKMLRRVIGEHIDLVLELAPDLGLVKADPGQIEQVLMNLVVNARDAMPDGGRLTIETLNVELDEDSAARQAGMQPGPHVLLVISDTGCGMDAATRQRAFEPFFTTKEKGRGTGLGLSTVYGIVKQSGGDIWVQSQPGQGSTFKVCLPRVAGELDAASTPVEQSQRVTGTETILVVEDEEAVRSLVVRVLRGAGFTVVSATHGGEALLVCEQHPGEIHLLLTDVVMPQMSGRQLAERLLRVRPDLRVLYMSGYADGALGQEGELELSAKFIAKPFGTEELTRKVREILDAPRR